MKYKRLFKDAMLFVMGISLPIAYLQWKIIDVHAVTPTDRMTNIQEIFDIPSGSQSQLSNDGVLTLTQPAANQNGAIWAKPNYKIDLTKPFQSTMYLNFGSSKDKAGDGMAFVLQGGDSSVLKKSDTGQQLGVWANPADGVGLNGANMDLSDAIANSFAIEFDTYNNYQAGTSYWDGKSFVQAGTGTSADPYKVTSATGITGNHVAYGFPGELVSATGVQTYDNVKSGYQDATHNVIYHRAQVHNGLYELGKNQYLSNGVWHRFNLYWTPGKTPEAKGTLQYTLDGNVNQVAKIIPAKDLGGSQVTWGFTGSTGAYYNEQNQVVVSQLSPLVNATAAARVLDGSGQVTSPTNQLNPFGAVKFETTVTDQQSNSWPWEWRNIRASFSKQDSDLTAEDASSFTVDGDSDAAGGNDFFGTNGYLVGDLAIGQTKKLTFEAISAGKPTPLTSDGSANAGSDYTFDYKGTANPASANAAVNASATAKLYVASVPSLVPSQAIKNATTADKAIAVDRTIDPDAKLPFSGTWDQTLGYDVKSKGTLHYQFSSGDQTLPEKTIYLGDTGVISKNLDITGLAQNKTYKVTVYVTNSGYNKESKKISFYFVIKNKSVAFSAVTGEIVFQPTIVGQNTLVHRQSVDWAPTVIDSRGAGSQWSVSAKSDGLQIPADSAANAGKKLDGTLVYVGADGKSQPITASGTLIESHTSTSDDEETQVGGANPTLTQGLLLQVNASAYKGDYQGQVNWVLATTPAP